MVDALLLISNPESYDKRVWKIWRREGKLYPVAVALKKGEDFNLD